MANPFSLSPDGPEGLPEACLLAWDRLLSGAQGWAALPVTQGLTEGILRTGPALGPFLMWS